MRNIFRTGRPTKFKLGTQTEPEDSEGQGHQADIMLRPEVRHSFRMERPTNFKLGVQNTDGVRKPV